MFNRLNLSNHMLILFLVLALPSLVGLVCALYLIEGFDQKIQEVDHQDLPLTRILGDIIREELGQVLRFNEILLYAKTADREKFEIANDAFIQYGKRINDSLLEGRNIAQKGVETSTEENRVRAIDALKSTLKDIEKIHGDYEHLGSTLIRGMYQYEFLTRPEQLKSGDHLLIEEGATNQNAFIVKTLSAMEDETQRLESKIKEGLEMAKTLSQALTLRSEENKKKSYQILVPLLFATLMALFALGMLVDRVHGLRRQEQGNQIRQVVGKIETATAKMAPSAQTVETIGNRLLDTLSRQGLILERMVKDFDGIRLITRDNLEWTAKSDEILDNQQTTMQQMGVIIESLDTDVDYSLSMSRETVKTVQSLRQRLLQINLLATNASAEASRNQATQGFSIFTEEIKEHARFSAQSSELVADLLEKSNLKIQSDVEKVKRLRARFEEVVHLSAKIKRILLDLTASTKTHWGRVEEIRGLMVQTEGILVGEKPDLEELMRAKNQLADQVEIIRESMSQWPEFATNRRTSPPQKLI